MAVNPVRLQTAASTDERGVADLVLGRAGIADVFVLPPAESFAFRKVSCEEADGEPKVVEISIPPGDATIRLRTTTQEGEPIAGVHFLVRVDGQMMNLDILDSLQVRGKRFRTGADGWAVVTGLPAGIYELWPFFSGPEVEGILSGSSGPAPVVVGARAGDNTATLTFARKPPAVP